MPPPPPPAVGERPPPSPTSTKSYPLTPAEAFFGLLLMIISLLYVHFDSKRERARQRTAAPVRCPPVGLRPRPPPTPAPPSPSMATLTRLYEYGKGRGWDAKNKDCSICLEEYKNGELCRMLVNCKHVFHGSCIDKWIVNKRHCPICRSSALVRVIYCSPDS